MVYSVFLFCCLQAGSRGAWLFLGFGVAYAILDSGQQWLKNFRSWLPFLGLGGVIVALFWMEPHLRGQQPVSANPATG